MIFNSLSFAIFLPIVFVLYWYVAKSKLRTQNMLLLAASYFFYASWDWRFMFILIGSTFLDYFTGIKIHEASQSKNKKFWLWLSVSINLGVLGVFKYYDFFIESFAAAFGGLGFNPNISTLNLILPVGISFYTFHGLSYVIDLYRDKIKPERNFINYSLFVSFFPLLVAGPIERATHLLPQIQKPRTFDYARAVDGMRQILWGLFKKIVIADNCAVYVNQFFVTSDDQSGSTLFIAAVFFAFQIYGDFSGYSDIALGTARLFGIELLRNFSFPYFSRDIAEFWRRWHISLSNWFRDYLYIPLGGSRFGKWKAVRNTLIIFVVSGFWHGANWTFIAWGTFHALLFLPLLLLEKNRVNTNTVAENRFFPNFKELFQMTFTFFLVVIGWIFFRAKDINHALDYIAILFSKSLFSTPIYAFGFNKSLIFILLMLLVEWVQREKQHGLELSGVKNQYVKWGIYYALILVIFEFGANSKSFIYFQF
jgi:alginate O-acetyltransferase complex protein AlgI